MSKISDELRKWGYGFCGDTHDVVTAIADRIDAEMVELPRDKDGIPIHVGDTVYLDDGRKAEVTRIDLLWCTTNIVCWASGKDCDCLPSGISHTRPDSWERIADELDDWKRKAAEKIPGFGLEEDALHALADRIRKLAEKESE